MKIAQKRAIGYVIRAKENEKRENFLKENNLWNEYKHSKYKSMLWFIKSKGINPYAI